MSNLMNIRPTKTHQTTENTQHHEIPRHRITKIHNRRKCR